MALLCAKAAVTERHLPILLDFSFMFSFVRLRRRQHQQRGQGCQIWRYIVIMGYLATEFATLCILGPVATWATRIKFGAIFGLLHFTGKKYSMSHQNDFCYQDIKKYSIQEKRICFYSFPIFKK